MASTSSQGPVRRMYDRYFVDAMSAMAYGLLASLIVGTILGQLSAFGPLAFLAPLGEILRKAEVVGAVIGAAVAWSLKTDAMVIMGSACAGAVGSLAGGPVGAFIGAVLGAEVGQLVSKRTPVDPIITPMVAALAGGLVSRWCGPYVSQFMVWLGDSIEAATQLLPLPMGLLVGLSVGMVLASPISSVALCASMELGGLAAGAALAGCCAQMIGFAVASYSDNGVSGLIAQGLGTAKLQLPNIMRRPQIWIAPSVASALCGGLAAALFRMECDMAGAGMGTCALVGQITTFSVMAPKHGAGSTLIAMAVLHFLLPTLIALSVDRVLRKLNWVRKGDMTLKKI